MPRLVPKSRPRNGSASSRSHPPKPPDKPSEPRSERDKPPSERQLLALFPHPPKPPDKPSEPRSERDGLSGGGGGETPLCRVDSENSRDSPRPEKLPSERQCLASFLHPPTKPPDKPRHGETPLRPSRQAALGTAWPRLVPPTRQASRGASENTPGEPRSERDGL